MTVLSWNGIVELAAGRYRAALRARRRSAGQLHVERLVRPLVCCTASMKSSNLACCCRKLAPAGLVASFFSVRCMRSCRPFCCGWPGLMRSMSMPRRSHQTDSLLRPNSALGRGEGHAVVGADRLGQAELLEDALEHGEGVGFLGRRQRLAGEQIAAGEVGDRQRIAVAPIGEHELALVVGAPQLIGLVGRRQRRARRPVAAPPCGA